MLYKFLVTAIALVICTLSNASSAEKSNILSKRCIDQNLCIGSDVIYNNEIRKINYFLKNDPVSLEKDGKQDMVTANVNDLERLLECDERFCVGDTVYVTKIFTTIR